MFSTLFIALQALALTSASSLPIKRQGISADVQQGSTYEEPARGEGRRILVWGRPDIALAALGDPAPGVPVGLRVNFVDDQDTRLINSTYATALDDAQIGRQLFEVNLHDDDKEPNQFDYTGDDDRLRLRGTQLCVTMSSPGNLTLETCDSSRDDDRNWIQDWEFDEEDGREWVKIEDDDDDTRCIAAVSNGDWANDQLGIMIDQCSNNSELQRFYQVLPGTKPEFAANSASPSGSASSTAAGSQTQSAGGSATSSPAPSGTQAPAGSGTPNASRPRINMWGQGVFRLLANL